MHSETDFQLVRCFVYDIHWFAKCVAYFIDFLRNLKLFIYNIFSCFWT